jgi:hypothetical protein
MQVQDIMWRMAHASDLIDVHHDDLFHRAMPQDLPSSSPLSASCYEDCARVGMQQHCQVHQELMIDKLISLRTL